MEDERLGSSVGDYATALGAAGAVALVAALVILGLVAVACRRQRRLRRHSSERMVRQGSSERLQRPQSGSRGKTIHGGGDNVSDVSVNTQVGLPLESFGLGIKSKGHQTLPSTARRLSLPLRPSNSRALSETFSTG